MKESGTDAALFAQFADVAPSSFAMLAGTGTVFYSDLCHGAVGGILAVAAVAPAPSERIPTAAMIRLRLAGKEEPPPVAAPFCRGAGSLGEARHAPWGLAVTREACRDGALYV